jgi:hypothetical protein
MKVFLSWSGERSKEAALALHGWLPTVIQTVRPYMSAENIDKGERWSVDIAKQLEETHFGIICVTPDNKEAPWILFEAGALSKSMERARVSPLAFGVSASDFTNSPLLQFQFTLFKKEDVRKLLHSINDAAPEAEKLAAEILNRTFDRGWKELEEEVGKINFVSPKSSSAQKPAHPAKLDNVLDELLTIARSQMKVLRSPELILPRDYLQQVIGLSQAQDLPGANHEVWNDLEKAVSELRAARRALDESGPSPAFKLDFAQASEKLTLITDYLFSRIGYLRTEAPRPVASLSLSSRARHLARQRQERDRQERERLDLLRDDGPRYSDEPDEV